MQKVLIPLSTAGLALALAFSLAACEPGGFGDTCDQGNWYFPCEVSSVDGASCTVHDFDDDGVPALYDADDYDPSAGAAFECTRTNAYGEVELYWSEYCQLFWQDICDLQCGYEAQFYYEGLYSNENDEQAYEMYCLPEG